MAHIEKRMHVYLDEEEIFKIFSQLVKENPDTVREVLLKITDDESVFDLNFEAVFGADKETYLIGELV